MDLRFTMYDVRCEAVVRLCSLGQCHSERSEESHWA